MSDRGMSMAESRSLVEVAGDIADHIKLTDHLGIMRRYSEEWIREKNAFYRESGIHTTTGGIPFEAARFKEKFPGSWRKSPSWGSPAWKSAATW